MFFAFPNNPLFAQDCSLSLPNYPLENLEPGKELSVYTVISGTKVEELEVKVVDLVGHPLRHNEKVVLFEMDEDRVIAAGMSGSPVCADDKVVGALAYSFGSFAKEKQLGGITPAEAIKNQTRALGVEQMGFPTTPTHTSLLSPIPTNIFSENRNFSADINGILHKMGYEGFSVLSIGENNNLNESALYSGNLAGQAVTMFLSRGDLNVGSTCTVTGDIGNNRISMCGHPVLGHGKIAVPAFRSSIATTFESSSYSFKLPAEALEPVGVAVYDNAFGVEIERAVDPSITTPVNISIQMAGQTHEYELEVVKQKPLTSYFAGYATKTFLKGVWGGYSEPAIAKLSARIYFKDNKYTDIYSYGKVAPTVTIQGQSASASEPWSNVLSRFQSRLIEMENNTLALPIQKITVDVEIVPGNNILELDRAYTIVNGAISEEAHPGDTVSIAVSLINNGDTISNRRWVRKRSFIIPENLNLVPPENTSQRYLPIHIFLMSGSHYKERDQMRLLSSERPQNVDDMISQFAMEIRDPAELFLQVVFPPEYTNNRGCSLSPPLKFTDTWRTGTIFNSRAPWCNTPKISQTLSASLGQPTAESLMSINKRYMLRLVINENEEEKGN